MQVRPAVRRLRERGRRRPASQPSHGAPAAAPPGPAGALRPLPDARFGRGRGRRVPVARRAGVRPDRDGPPHGEPAAGERLLEPLDAGRRARRRRRCVSGRVRCTSATSRAMRGSVAWRISSRARPTSSMARVTARSPRRSAHAFARSRSASVAWSSGAPMRTRNTSRSRLSSASARVRGSRPPDIASATALMARPASTSQIASTRSSMWLPSGATPPAATAWSSAESVSRAEPPP